MSNYDILVTIGGDISGLTRAASQAQSKVNGLTSGISKAATTTTSYGARLESAGQKVMNAGALMTATFGAASYGMVKGIGASVGAAAKFETAWAGVEKTVDGNAKQMKALQRELLSVTKAMPQSTTEIFAVAEAAGQLGIERKNIAGFTKTMLDLGVSTNMSSEEASTALARLANITQMPQKNFDRLGATIVDLGNNFATTEKEITEMGLRLAGQGKQVGMSEAQIMSLSAAMSSVGINAEAGGTAMTMVMKKINNAVDTGGQKLDGFAKLAGMSSQEFQKAWKDDASTALDAVIHGLAKSGKEGENLTAILGDLGIKGIRESDVMLRLSGNADLLTKALAVGNKAWKDNTALLAEANKRYKTFDSQVGISEKVMSEFGRAIGTPIKDVLASLLQAINKVVIKLTSFINKFNEANPTMAKILAVVALVVTGLTILGTALGAILIVVGPLIPIIFKLSTGFIALKKGTTLLGVALRILTGPIGIIIGILSVLGTIFYSLYKDNESFRNAVNATGAALKGGFLVALNAVKIALQAVGQFFAKVGEVLKASFLKALADSNSQLSKFISFCKQVGTAIKVAFGVALEFAISLFEKLATMLGTTFTSSVSGVVALLEQFGGAFGAIGGAISLLVGIVSKFGLALLGISGPLGIVISLIISFITAWAKTGDFSANGITKVFDDLSRSIENVSMYLNKNLPKFIDFGGKLITNIINGITKAIPKIVSVITKIIETFTNTLTTILPQIIDVGVSILTSLIDGIISAIPRIVSAITMIIDTYVKTISSLLPMILEAGLTILLALIDGIVTALPQITNAAIAILTGLLYGVIAALPMILGAGLQIIMALVKGILNALPTILNAAIQIITALLNALITALPAIIDAGIQILTALIDGIILILPQLILAAVNLIIAIVTALIDNIGKIIDAGIQLVMALIEGLIKILPQLIEAGITLLMAIIEAIINNLPKIIDAGVRLIIALIEGLIKVLPQLVSAAVKLAVELIKAIIKYAPQILAAGVKLIMALISGLLKMLGKLLSTGGDLVMKLLSKLGSFAGKMLDKGVEMIRKFIDGISNKAGELGEKAKSLGKKAVDSIKNGFSKIADAGGDLVKGLWNGISDMAGWIKSKIQGFGKGVLDSLKDFFGIHSPSRVMRDQIGKYIPAGIAVGILGNAKQVKTAALSLGKSVSNAVEDGLSSNKVNTSQINNLVNSLKLQQSQLSAVVTKRAQVTAKIKSLNKQLTIAPKAKKSSIAKQITAAKNQLTSYNNQMQSLNNRINTSKNKLTSLAINKKEAQQAIGLASIQKYLTQQTNKLQTIAKQRDSVVAKLKSANTNLASLVKESAKYATDVAKKMSDFASIANLTGTTNLDANSVEQFLSNRLKAIKSFQANVDALRKKGVDKNIIADILDAGVEQGAAYAKALANADSKTIASINNTQKAIETASNSMGNTAANAMYSAGINAAKGLIKGLESQQKALNKQATKIGDAIVKAIKSKLKIHSPSRVMRDDIGQYIPLGIVEGIKSQLDVLKAASTEMVDAATPDLSTISSNITQDMNGSLSGAVTASVNANQPDQSWQDTLSMRIDALGDRISEMSVNIDGKTAGNILRTHVSEAEAKEQRRQFKAKGKRFNN
ncbi:phage tail tape measure protein [Listeria monocytogenes]|nr:phage tail tape measure protein [Listeria monocytogenes]